jgi:hypothetical protein
MGLRGRIPQKPCLAGLCIEPKNAAAQIISMLRNCPLHLSRRFNRGGEKAKRAHEAPVSFAA